MHEMSSHGQELTTSRMAKLSKIRSLLLVKLQPVIGLMQADQF